MTCDPEGHQADVRAGHCVLGGWPVLNSAAGRLRALTAELNEVEGSVSSGLWSHPPSVNKITHSSKVDQAHPVSTMVPEDSSRHTEQG